MTGTCEFCGQVVTIDSGREPWEVCQCSEATDKRRRDAAIAQAIEGAERIFGADAKDIGFAPVDESLMAVIKGMIEDVGRGRIRGVTAKLMSGETVTIKADGLEISIKRKEQRTAVA